MARMARVVAIGYPHHITQRGNYGQNVFVDDEDREQYLRWIQYESEKFELSLFVHTLMTNHVHFIGIPNKEDSLAKTFSAAHMKYAQYFNKKRNRKGHLWQGRFYSCVLDDSHLITAARYIERNPVRAGLVSKPWGWKWSSASVHTGKCNEAILKLEDLFRVIGFSQEEWKAYIELEDIRKDVDNIKKQTLNGRPLGGKQFINNLEQTLGRKLTVRSQGRPRKV